MNEETPREKWIRLLKYYNNKDYHKCNSNTIIKCGSSLLELLDISNEVDEPLPEMFEYDLSIILEKALNLLREKK